MYVGTINTVIVERGFGFIRVPGMQDVFMHCNTLGPDLEWDETLKERRVQFDMDSDHRGLRARNVRAAD